MINNSTKPARRQWPKADDEDRWIDVHDRELMIYLGIQQPPYEGRDESLWSKTIEERAKLAYLKARCTTILPRQWPVTETRSPLFAKLIVRVRPSNKFKTIDKHGNEHKKTYFSHKNVCLSDIPDILAKYYVWKDKSRQTLVISYTWNGKTYSPNELPNVRWK